MVRARIAGVTLLAGLLGGLLPCAVGLAAGAGAGAGAGGGHREERRATSPAVWREELPRERVFLDVGRVYDPPLADPLWPRFSASSLRTYGGFFLEQQGRVGFGETIAFYRTPVGRDWMLELGMQPSLFGSYDIGRGNVPLYHSDWQIGIYAAARRGRFSTLARVHHVSGHIGDKFLVFFDGPYRDFSHESFDAYFAYDIASQFRIYGGGGYMINIDPDHFDPVFLVWGADFYSSTTFASGWIRPVAGLHVRHLQAKDFQFDVSLRGGLQFQDPRRVMGPRFYLMLEAYNGSDPNGSFWEDNHSAIGAGIHVNL